MTPPAPTDLPATPPEDPMTDTACPVYPGDAWHTFYGRQLWPLGDGGEDGVLVERSDRRSYAALSRYLREEGCDRDVDPVPRWVRAFVQECGCTEAEHAAHREDDIDCADRCEHYGLPPCEELYACWIDWATAGEPALAVLQVTW